MNTYFSDFMPYSFWSILYWPRCVFLARIRKVFDLKKRDVNFDLKKRDADFDIIIRNKSFILKSLK